MIEKKIALKSINDVKNFVNIAITYKGDIDLVHDRYSIDAKSIMGVFSLDLSKPITMRIHDTLDNAAAFLSQIGEYVVC